jgi:hypothetical protein
MPWLKSASATTLDQMEAMGNLIAQALSSLHSGQSESTYTITPEELCAKVDRLLGPNWQEVMLSFPLPVMWESTLATIKWFMQAQVKDA